MSNERQNYASGGWGMRSRAASRRGSSRSSTSSSKATPQRVEAARQLFRRRRSTTSSAIGNRGRKCRHQGSGREYVLDEAQVLMAPDPRKIRRRVLRRPRRQAAVHAASRLRRQRERGIPGQIRLGEFGQSPGGGIRVVDARTGAIVREGLRL